MKKVIILVLALVLLLGGVGVLVYPRVQQALYVQYANRIISGFESRMEERREESEDGTLRWLHDKMVAYNQRLYENAQAYLIDPFSYEQVSFSLIEFGFEEELIGYITIPRIDETLPIFLGSSDANMRRGATHMTQSSLPIGGLNTNAVIAAHRGLSRARMFRHINRLQYGDPIYITNFYETIRYEVFDTMIIYPDEIDAVLIQSGRDIITLLTCHPYRVNTQRLLVFAERVG